MVSVLLYALLWASFGAGHSALAAPLGRGLLRRIAGAGDRLATAAAATAYLLVGIRFEERNLLRIYGDSYRRYRSHVPMLVPRRLWPR